MEDILGMGKVLDVTSGNIPVDCKKNGSSIAVNGGICSRTYCAYYGKWWCPFTGWFK
jgi:hypothetical protein